jgi:hypothetical protein
MLGIVYALLPVDPGHLVQLAVTAGELKPELVLTQIVRLILILKIVMVEIVVIQIPPAPLSVDLGALAQPLAIITAPKSELVLEQIAQPIQTVKLVMGETALPPAPLPVDLGVPALLLATEELKPEPALEQTVQLTLNLKLVILNLVAPQTAPVPPLPA